MLDFIIIAICIILLVKHWKMVAPFAPTSSGDVPRIAAIIEKYDCHNCCDLGSGVGHVIGNLARRFPDRQFTGFDLAPLLILVSRLRFRKQTNCQVHFGNFFERDWQEYDCLFMFWLPRAFVRAERLTSRLRTGQIIISYAFPIPCLADKLLVSDQPVGRLPIFVYRY